MDNILPQLLLCVVSLIMGVALGFTLAKLKHEHVRATLLVLAGLLVGGLLGYTYVLSSIFSIKSEIK